MSRNGCHARARALALASTCTATLLIAVLAPAGAAAAASRNGRAGVSHVKASPLFPVPASARVHGTPSSDATSTAGTTTTPATTATQPGTTTTPATTATQPGTTTPSTTTTPSAGSSSVPPSSIPAPGTSSSTRLGLARAHRRSASKVSTAALIGAVVAGLLVLLCAAWAAVRWLAVEPRWTRSLTYSLEEASFRASATWAELLDWARIGR